MSEGVQERRWQLAIRLTVASIVWSVGLILAALLIGAYTGQTVSTDAGVTLTTRTFIQVNGLSALILVALPTAGCVIVAAVLHHRHHRHHRRSAWSGAVAWTALGLVAVEAVAGIATFGAFLIPVVVLLGLSVRLVSGPAATPAPARASNSPAIDR